MPLPIEGTDNSEVINALDGVTNGDDIIWAYDGNDTISGLGGHDQIKGGGGADAINGGGGSDTAVYIDSTVGVAEGADVETLALANANGTDDLALAGNSSGNSIIGNNGDNVLRAAAAPISSPGVAATTSTGSTAWPMRSSSPPGRASTRCGPAQTTR
jgi:hypothetical protein